MATKKRGSILIKMVSTGVMPDGSKTGTFYVTTKNPKSLNTTEKLQMNKYDKRTRKHELFKEEKIK